MRPRWSVLRLLAPVALLPLVAGAAADPPTVTVEPDPAAVGGQLTVRLDQWPAGNVQLELCGNRAARGSADCAVTAGVQTYVGGDGRGVGLLPVTAPPVDCPCLLRARGLESGATATAALAVTGFDADPAPEPLAAGAVELTQATVEGGWSWASLFGGPASRTVTATFVNPGPEPVELPAPVLLLGGGLGADDRPTTALPAPAPGEVVPDRPLVYRVPVTLPAPAIGHYTVRGDVGGAAFLVETTSYPWGWPAAIAGLALLLLAVRLGRRISRRLRRGRAASSP